MKETNRIKKSFIVQQNAIDDFFYMSRYCRNFIRILTLANRIKSHFFAGSISSNSEGMYSYIKHTQNRLKNADKILMIKVM